MTSSYNISESRFRNYTQDQRQSLNNRLSKLEGKTHKTSNNMKKINALIK